MDQYRLKYGKMKDIETAYKSVELGKKAEVIELAKIPRGEPVSFVNVAKARRREVPELPLSCGRGAGKSCPVAVRYPDSKEGEYPPTNMNIQNPADQTGRI